MVFETLQQKQKKEMMDHFRMHWIGISASECVYNNENFLSSFLEKSKLKKEDVHILKEGEGCVLFEVQGYKQVFAAFRGTQTMEDGLDDASIILQRGFNQLYSVERYSRFIDEARKDNLIPESKNLYIFGHSLGALVAGFVASNQKNTCCLTYDNPGFGVLHLHQLKQGAYYDESKFYTLQFTKNIINSFGDVPGTVDRLVVDPSLLSGSMYKNPEVVGDKLWQVMVDLKNSTLLSEGVYKKPAVVEDKVQQRMITLENPIPRLQSKMLDAFMMFYAKHSTLTKHSTVINFNFLKSGQAVIISEKSLTPDVSSLPYPSLSDCQAYFSDLIKKDDFIFDSQVMQSALFKVSGLPIKLLIDKINQKNLEVAQSRALNLKQINALIKLIEFHPDVLKKENAIKGKMPALKWNNRMLALGKVAPLGDERGSDEGSGFKASLHNGIITVSSEIGSTPVNFQVPVLDALFITKWLGSQFINWLFLSESEAEMQTLYNSLSGNEAIYYKLRNIVNCKQLSPERKRTLIRIVCLGDRYYLNQAFSVYLGNVASHVDSEVYERLQAILKTLGPNHPDESTIHELINGGSKKRENSFNYIIKNEVWRRSSEPLATEIERLAEKETFHNSSDVSAFEKLNKEYSTRCDLERILNQPEDRQKELELDGFISKHKGMSPGLKGPIFSYYWGTEINLAKSNESSSMLAPNSVLLYWEASAGGEGKISYKAKNRAGKNVEGILTAKNCSAYSSLEKKLKAASETDALSSGEVNAVLDLIEKDHPKLSNFARRKPEKIRALSDHESELDIWQDYLLARTDNPSEADGIVQKGAELHPESFSNLYAYHLIKKADKKRKQGDVNEAKALYLEALKKAGKLLSVRSEVIPRYVELFSQDVEGKEAMIKGARDTLKALGEKKEDDSFYAIEEILYCFLGAHPELANEEECSNALARLDQMGKSNSLNKAIKQFLYNKSIVHYEKKEFKEALSLCQACLKASNNEKETLGYVAFLATCYLNLENPIEAISLLEKQIAILDKKEKLNKDQSEYRKNLTEFVKEIESTYFEEPVIRALRSFDLIKINALEKSLEATQCERVKQFCAESKKLLTQYYVAQAIQILSKGAGALSGRFAESYTQDEKATLALAISQVGGKIYSEIMKVKINNKYRSQLKTRKNSLEKELSLLETSDQFLWSPEMHHLIADGLREAKKFHANAVDPRYYDLHYHYTDIAASLFDAAGVRAELDKLSKMDAKISEIADEGMKALHTQALNYKKAGTAIHSVSIALDLAIACDNLIMHYYPNKSLGLNRSQFGVPAARLAIASASDGINAYYSEGSDRYFFLIKAGIQIASSLFDLLTSSEKALLEEGQYLPDNASFHYQGLWRSGKQTGYYAGPIKSIIAQNPSLGALGAATCFAGSLGWNVSEINTRNLLINSAIAENGYIFKQLAPKGSRLFPDNISPTRETHVDGDSREAFHSSPSESPSTLTLPQAGGISLFKQETPPVEIGYRTIYFFLGGKQGCFDGIYYDSRELKNQEAVIRNAKLTLEDFIIDFSRNTYPDRFGVGKIAGYFYDLKKEKEAIKQKAAQQYKQIEEKLKISEPLSDDEVAQLMRMASKKGHCTLEKRDLNLASKKLRDYMKRSGKMTDPHLRLKEIQYQMTLFQERFPELVQRAEEELANGEYVKAIQAYTALIKKAETYGLSDYSINFLKKMKTIAFFRFDLEQNCIEKCKQHLKIIKSCTLFEEVFLSSLSLIPEEEEEVSQSFLEKTIYLTAKNGRLFYRTASSGSHDLELTENDFLASGVDKEKINLIFKAAKEKNHLIEKLTPFASDLISTLISKKHWHLDEGSELICLECALQLQLRALEDFMLEEDQGIDESLNNASMIFKLRQNALSETEILLSRMKEILNKSSENDNPILKQLIDKVSLILSKLEYSDKKNNGICSVREADSRPKTDLSTIPFLFLFSGFSKAMGSPKGQGGKVSATPWLQPSAAFLNTFFSQYKITYTGSKLKRIKANPIVSRVAAIHKGRPGIAITASSAMAALFYHQAPQAIASTMESTLSLFSKR